MRPAIGGLATVLALSGSLWTADLMLGPGTARAVCSTNNGGNQPPVWRLRSNTGVCPPLAWMYP